MRWSSMKRRLRGLYSDGGHLHRASRSRIRAGLLLELGALTDLKLKIPLMGESGEGNLMREMALARKRMMIS